MVNIDWNDSKTWAILALSLIVVGLFFGALSYALNYVKEMGLL